jgi:MFS family permease
LLLAAPGALLGGWLGEHVGLRSALGFAAGVSALLVLVAWRLPAIRQLKQLPELERADDWVGGEALMRAPGVLPGQARTQTDVRAGIVASLPLVPSDSPALPAPVAPPTGPSTSPSSANDPASPR